MLSKYRQNLHVAGNKVYSYHTHVATIVGNELHIHGYHSMTTSKHVNYVAEEYGLTRVYDKEKIEETPKQQSNPFAAMAMIAKIGELEHADDIKAQNDWKARMIKAGMGEGISMPDDWNELSEEEKKQRLDGVIAIALEPHGKAMDNERPAKAKKALQKRSTRKAN